MQDPVAGLLGSVIFYFSESNFVNCKASAGDTRPMFPHTLAPPSTKSHPIIHIFEGIAPATAPWPHSFP